MTSKQHPTYSAYEKYLDHTVTVWQPYYELPLSREDAREIATNVSGFVQLLGQWAHEDRMQRASSIAEKTIMLSFGKAKSESLSVTRFESCQGRFSDR